MNRPGRPDGERKMSEPFATVTIKLFEDGSTPTEIDWGEMPTHARMAILDHALRGLDKFYARVLASMPANSVSGP